MGRVQKKTAAQKAAVPRTPFWKWLVTLNASRASHASGHDADLLDAGAAGRVNHLP